MSEVDNNDLKLCSCWHYIQLCVSHTYPLPGIGGHRRAIPDEGQVITTRLCPSCHVKDAAKSAFMGDEVIGASTAC